MKVWVGLDFGTSFTKVAYRVLGGSRKVIPLCMNQGSSIPYGLPSLLAFDGEKILFGDEAENFLRESPWHQGVRCVKILFAGDVADEYKDESLSARFREYCEGQIIDSSLLEPGYLVAAYFVWIMNRTKKVLRKELGTNPLVNFNVCLPIDTYEKKNVRSEFQRAINVAEHLELLWDEKSDSGMLKTIAALWKKTSDKELSNSKVHLVPEAVAQMASYTNSLGAEKKIHGVIDFGAGTIDFSIFNLRDESEEGKCVYWYNAVTFPGGMEGVEEIVAKHRSKSDGNISFGELRKAIENISAESPVVLEEVKELLESVWEKARFPVWGKAYAKMKKESEWKKEKVKVFVCGGGSKLPFVRDIFGRSWYRDDWGPYEVADLYAPSDFSGSPSDFSRLAVAYGLTTPRPELMEYVLPKDCKDQTPPTRYVTTERDGVWGPVYFDNH
ncbi:MAG: hypothetical protein GX181_05570 [Synergistaceae bacterium]|nr:hypothetical protein [Synergistaceae bacterium]